MTATLSAGLIVTPPALVLLSGESKRRSTRIALPIFGMVAGAAMTGVALALDTFAQTVVLEVGAIEAQWVVGATRDEALRPVNPKAVTRGMMPTINAVAAIGVVTIPGMMTGKLLAGAEVFGAARLQMLLICGATGTGALGATYAMARRTTDSRHRLRLEPLNVRK